MDEPLFKFLLHHIKTASIILDVGCAGMDELVELKKIFPTATYHMFDADPRWHSNAGKLKGQNVHFYPIAITSKDGPVNFHQSIDWKLSSSIRQPKEHIKVHPWIKFSPPIIVPGQSLNTWFKNANLDHIDLIWADVQGAEGDLIDGGQEALAKTRYFYTECDDIELYEGQANPQQILQRLPNFELIEKYKDNILLENKYL